MKSTLGGRLTAQSGRHDAERRGKSPRERGNGRTRRHCGRRRHGLRKLQHGEPQQILPWTRAGDIFRGTSQYRFHSCLENLHPVQAIEPKGIPRRLSDRRFRDEADDLGAGKSHPVASRFGFDGLERRVQGRDLIVRHVHGHLHETAAGQFNADGFQVTQSAV